MNTRLNRTTLALLAAMALSAAGCEAAKPTGTVSRGPATPLEKQYVETIDRLLPGMGAEKVVDRKDAQIEFEGICFAASAPGKDADCAALSRAIMTKVGPEIAKPARVWLLRKVEPIGRDEVVAGLTKLLGDDDVEIRDLARRALQNNPSRKATAALRDELAKADDTDWRVALINALAARRDAESVKTFSKFAAGEDAAVAKAAVAALGDIGDDAAVATLTRLLKAGGPMHEAAVDACLRSAEKLVVRGAPAKAVAIYEQLDVPSEREGIRIAAVEGLARTQGTKAVPRFTKLINGDDVHMQLIAAQCLRDMPDPKVTADLAASLDAAPPAAAAILLDVLGQRGDPAALPAVVKKADDGNPEVRVAALNALRTVGNGSVVGLLAEHAAKGTAQERDAARDSLARLRGPDVDKVIVAAIDKAEPSLRSVLVRAAADRRSSALLPTLYANVDDPDEAARVAVVKALGRLAPTADLSKVVDALVKARGDAMRTATEEAVRLIAERIADREKRTAPVIAALAGAPAQAQVSLIHVLGQLQGDAALAALRTCQRSEDKAVKDAAAQALSKWPGQHCTKWLFAGPYKKEGLKAADLFDTAFAPEDADAKPAWKPLKADANEQSGEIVLSKVHKEQECCGYVKTNVWSDEDQEVRLSLGSDDGVKVWLNGAVVHAKNAARALNCGEDTLTVKLKKGWNPLLIKITQGGGDWSFCCGMTAVTGGPVEGLKVDTKGGR